MALWGARRTERFIVVSFHTTSDAFAFQAAAKRAGLRGRLAPIPRQLSAGCGMAWREPLGERDGDGRDDTRCDGAGGDQGTAGCASSMAYGVGGDASVDDGSPRASARQRVEAVLAQAHIECEHFTELDL